MARLRVSTVAISNAWPTRIHQDAYAHSSYSGLVVGTASLTSTVPSTFAFDKPVYAAIVCLTTLAAVLLALGRLLPKGDTSIHKGQYSAVPLEEAHANDARGNHSPHRPDAFAHPTSLRRLRALFLALVIAICLRVELARQAFSNIQCAHGTWEPVVPLAFAAWDWLCVRRRRQHQVELDEQSATLYDVWECRIMNSPYRYLVAVGLACFGGLGAIRAIGSPPSTHICAASLPYSWVVPLSQYAGTALDVVILLCVNGLLHRNDGHGSKERFTRISTIGWACLVRKHNSHPKL